MFSFMSREANISTESGQLLKYSVIFFLDEKYTWARIIAVRKLTKLKNFMVYVLYKICQLWFSNQYIICIYFMHFVNRTVPGYLVRMQIKRMSSTLLFVIVSMIKKISSYHKLWYSNPKISATRCCRPLIFPLCRFCCIK